MDIYKAQRIAQDNGYDSLEFYAHFPAGRKKCQWLDADFGLFEVDGLNGFMTVRQADEMFPDLLIEQPANEKEKAGD